MKEGKKIIVWFRNDLRLHDHQPLNEALSRATQVIPVFCFDPRYFRLTKFGTEKTGIFRARFLIESVSALRENLRSKGADLLVLCGKPEDVLIQVAIDYGVSHVLAYKEVASEEIKIADLVEEKLWKNHIPLDLFLGNTLFNKEDLPFPIKDIPNNFAQFKKRVERDSHVRKSFEEPQSIPCVPLIDCGVMPDLNSFGYQDFSKDDRAVLDFKGGEQEGLKRLNEYVWEKELIKTYKHTRNKLLGADYSSKLSPWLSLGCLSPRKVYEEIKSFENDRVSNGSTQELFHELLWRDYFRFLFKKFGNTMFRLEGLKNKSPESNLLTENDLYTKWKDGKTGIPFIDANMRELLATGFMSNKGRQVVSSFLIYDCKVRWTLGAAWFEECLIDYNPASNWGSWSYIAGVSGDAKETLSLHILKQAYDNDSKGEYVKLWIPELQNLPSYLVQQPYLMTLEQQALYGITIGNNYPSPVVELKKFEKQY